jgi:hypothetical protein
MPSISKDNRSLPVLICEVIHDMAEVRLSLPLSAVPASHRQLFTELRLSTIYEAICFPLKGIDFNESNANVLGFNYQTLLIGLIIHFRIKEP